MRYEAACQTSLNDSISLYHCINSVEEERVSYASIVTLSFTYVHIGEYARRKAWFAKG